MNGVNFHDEMVKNMMNTIKDWGITREELINNICPSVNIRDCCDGDACFNCDDCSKELNKLFEKHDKQIRAEVIYEIKKILPPIYCNNCSQIACDGGRVGSIQECASVRLLIDVLGELEKQLKENK